MYKPLNANGYLVRLRILSTLNLCGLFCCRAPSLRRRSSRSTWKRAASLMPSPRVSNTFSARVLLHGMLPHAAGWPQVAVSRLLTHRLTPCYSFHPSVLVGLYETPERPPNAIEYPQPVCLLLSVACMPASTCLFHCVWYSLSVDVRVRAVCVCSVMSVWVWMPLAPGPPT